MMTSPAPAAQAARPRPRSLLVRVLTSPAARGGLVMMLLIGMVALLGPLFAPHDPTSIIGRPFQGPSADALLGTDNLGRDVLSRVLNGGRSLILMALLAALLGTALGAVLGVAAAYYRGAVEAIILRVVDVLLAFPAVVLVLLVVSMVGPSEWLLVLLVGLAHVASVTRVMRGAALGVVDRDFVLWSKAVGLSGWRILTGEIIPNVASPLMVEFGLRLMWSVGALAALSFLGFGIQPPASDWGLMVNENRSALSSQPWAVIVPILGIAVFTVGGNLFAEGTARVMGRTESGGGR